MKNHYTFLKRVLLLGSLVLFLGSAIAPKANAQLMSTSDEGIALMAIYNATAGATWTDNTNWGSLTEPIDNWYGVTVVSDKVVKLDLKLNNLVGGPLPDVFDDLSDLKSLNLRDNSITGALPTTFGDLVNLTFLSLKGNEFSGNLPAGFSNLVALKEVWIHDNLFTGDVPDIAGFTSLLYFSIGENGFTGFAGSLAALPLRELYVAENYFDFADLIPLKGIATNLFKYAPQKNFGSDTPIAKLEGDALNISSGLSTGTNTYQWYKGVAMIAGKTADPLAFASLLVGDAGTYFVKVMNPALPLLTLTSANWTLTVGPAGPSGFPEWYITSDAAGYVELVIQEPPTPPSIWRALVYTEKWTGTEFEYVELSSSLDFTASPGPTYTWNPNAADLNTVSVLDQARKMKIQLQDGNGVKSELSDFQQSQHVTINQGLTAGDVNLIWTPYLGRTVTSYVVLGAHALADFYTPNLLVDVWPLATLPSDARSYTDIGGGYAFYMVAAVLASPVPLKGGETIMSKSNPVSKDMIAMEFEAKMNIYPNPVNDMATIEFDNLTDSEFSMYLLDLSGKVIRTQENITGTSFTFDRGNLRKGIYIVQMVGDRTINRKMIIE